MANVTTFISIKLDAPGITFADNCGECIDQGLGIRDADYALLDPDTLYHCESLCQGHWLALCNGACTSCDCADPTCLDGIKDECDCACHGRTDN